MNAKKIDLMVVTLMVMMTVTVLSLTNCSPAPEEALAVEETTQGTVIGSDQELFTVIFEFNVEPDQQEELSQGIQQLVDEIVSNQPGFISANLHLSTDGEKVLNYFQWESKEAFDAFRGNEEAMSQIQPVIGPYGPQPRVYNIVYSLAR